MRARGDQLRRRLAGIFVPARPDGKSTTCRETALKQGGTASVSSPLDGKMKAYPTRPRRQGRVHGREAVPNCHDEASS